MLFRRHWPGIGVGCIPSAAIRSRLFALYSSCLRTPLSIGLRPCRQALEQFLCRMSVFASGPALQYSCPPKKPSFLNFYLSLCCCSFPLCLRTCFLAFLSGCGRVVGSVSRFGFSPPLNPSAIRETPRVISAHPFPSRLAQIPEPTLWVSTISMPKLAFSSCKCSLRTSKR